MGSVQRQQGGSLILTLLVIAMASPPLLHPRLSTQAQTTLAFPWVQICSVVKVAFLNLETGERKEQPAQPGDPTSHVGCHGALCRREQACHE